MNASTDKRRSILLIEDDVVDVLTLRRALRDAEINMPLRVVENGEEALRYLRNTGDELPAVIILDLNMPRMNGIEFLRIAKTDEEIRPIPVVVLTTSAEEKDKHDAFMCGIAGYLLKPVEYDTFVQIMRTFNDYWSLCELP